MIGIFFCNVLLPPKKISGSWPCASININALSLLIFEVKLSKILSCIFFPPLPSPLVTLKSPELFGSKSRRYPFAILLLIAKLNNETWFSIWLIFIFAVNNLKLSIDGSNAIQCSNFFSFIAWTRVVPTCAPILIKTFLFFFQIF